MLCPACHRVFQEPGLRYCPHDGAELTSKPRITLLRSTPCPETGILLAERYRIVGFAGEGSMAQILLGVDTHTKEPVALKTLRTSGTDREKRRLFNEVLSAAAVQHPNVTGILDVVEGKERLPYIVMEYLQGETLGDHLRRKRVARTDLLLPLLTDAAMGLAAAHECGIVHRDVKPDNVFLVGAIDAPHTAKIVDFGLAKSHVKLTSIGTAIGTVEYMAPEQVLADDIDLRVDVYGFGIVLYRTFAGRLPFDSPDKHLVMAQQYLEPPPPIPEELLDDPRIALVIAKALRKHPSNRYQSMHELAEDLERIMGRRDGPMTAREPDAVEDLHRPTSDFPRLAAKVFYETLGMTPPPSSSAKS
jgi:serine/threonine protein kinase